MRLQAHLSCLCLWSSHIIFLICSTRSTLLVAGLHKSAFNISMCLTYSSVQYQNCLFIEQSKWKSTKWPCAIIIIGRNSPPTKTDHFFRRADMDEAKLRQLWQNFIIYPPKDAEVSRVVFWVLGHLNSTWCLVLYFDKLHKQYYAWSKANSIPLQLGSAF